MATLSDEEKLVMNQRVHEMHLEIFRAIRDRDVESARRAMEVHLRAFGSDLK